MKIKIEIEGESEFRKELIEKYGEESSEVKQFEQYIDRARELISNVLDEGVKGVQEN